MKKILFITHEYPFPATNGVKIPIAGLMAGFSKIYEIDLLLVDSSTSSPSSIKLTDNLISYVHRLQSKKYENRFFRVLKELLFIQPSFYRQACLSDLTPVFKERLKEYDIVYISPFWLFPIKLQLKGLVSGCRFVVGLNDSKLGHKLNSFLYIIKRPRYAHWSRWLGVIRIPWFYFYERNLVKRCRYIHVQTPNEKDKIERLYKTDRFGCRVLDVHNSCSVPRKLTKAVREPIINGDIVVTLFGSWNDSRQDELRWFCENVWLPLVKKRPEFKLYCIGQNGDLPIPMKGVTCMPFIDDLDNFLLGVDVGVIPSLHSSGWINRVVDLSKASIPIVGTTEIISTFTNLSNRPPIIKADTAQQFVNALIALKDDSDFYIRSSDQSARFFQAIPSWCDQVSSMLESINIRST